MVQTLIITKRGFLSDK